MLLSREFLCRMPPVHDHGPVSWSLWKRFRSAVTYKQQGDGEEQARDPIPSFALVTETTGNGWHSNLTRARSRNLSVVVYARSC